MADIRINGKRIVPLQHVEHVSVLIQKLENMAETHQSALTSIAVNQNTIDIDAHESGLIRLSKEDTVDARFDTPEQLSFESVQVALDMADLLVIDLKLAAVDIWDEKKSYAKTLETLLKDCHLFLSLAARPIYLLNKNLDELDVQAQNCLKELDRIAEDIENATLLAVHGRTKDACYVLAGIVKPAVERWCGLSLLFAESLHIETKSKSVFEE